MTSIFEITDWAHMASFCVWTLAVCALAKAIFGSFPAAELQYRLAVGDNPRRQRINRLNWEVHNRMAWSPDVNSPFTAQRPLEPAELEAKKRELEALVRGSFARRALLYFGGCFLCQAFWTALIVYALTAGIADLGAWFFSAAAYSGAGVIIMGVQGSAPWDVRPSAAAGGCRGCDQ